jgi:hypothetical protein
MDSLKTELEAFAIVLIGSFNPPIYQPEWFARMGLIREEEAKNAKIDVVHADIASALIGSIKIQVRSDRFTATTLNAADYETLRDLVVGTFKTLPHTPIRLMGLNFDAHYRLSSLEAWHALGDRLAPKGMWSAILDKPGMGSLMIEGRRRDNRKGYVRVKVEPSMRIKDGVGVFVNVNDHYEVPDHKPEDGCGAIIDTLIQTWDYSLKQGRLICESIVRS